jgi:hypothetical protein
LQDQAQLHGLLDRLRDLTIRVVRITGEEARP